MTSDSMFCFFFKILKIDSKDVFLKKIDNNGCRIHNTFLKKIMFLYFIYVFHI